MTVEGSTFYPLMAHISEQGGDTLPVLKQTTQAAMMRATSGINGLEEGGRYMCVKDVMNGLWLRTRMMGW